MPTDNFILQKLVAIGEDVASIKGDTGAIKNLVMKHEAVLEGDNTEDSPGLRTRVDRLEQTDKRRTRQLAALGAALVSLALTEVKHFIDAIKHLVSNG